MKTAMILSVSALFLLATVGNVFCEDIAKEGPLSGHAYVSGMWKGHPLGEGTQFMTWQQKGIMLDDSGEGPFHNMSSNCAGVMLLNKGLVSAFGYCIGFAPNGDNTLYEVTEDNQEPGPGLRKGTWKLIGGTGNFAGIEGGGEYTSYALRPAEDGTYQNVLKTKGKYKLP